MAFPLPFQGNTEVHYLAKYCDNRENLLTYFISMHVNEPGQPASLGRIPKYSKLLITSHPHGAFKIAAPCCRKKHFVWSPFHCAPVCGKTVVTLKIFSKISVANMLANICNVTALPIKEFCSENVTLLLSLLKVRVGKERFLDDEILTSGNFFIYVAAVSHVGIKRTVQKFSEIMEKSQLCTVSNNALRQHFEKVD